MILLIFKPKVESSYTMESKLKGMPAREMPRSFRVDLNYHSTLFVGYPST
jgi:hypothetical protein